MNSTAEALKSRTFRFALAIIVFCRELRKTWEGRELSDQLFRSGTRVGANYHAACRASSHADFVNKIGIVVEEADESVYWLKLIREGNLCPDAEVAPLLQEASELWAIFNQSQITAKGNSPAARRNFPKPATAPKAHAKSVNS